MKNLFKTICDFIFSCENRVIKNSILDSGSIKNFIGDTDKETSNIKYNKIFQPFYSEASIIENKNINEESFFNNFKLNFNSKDNLLKLSDKNFKSANRNLIKEFDEVANNQKNPETLINLKYNNIKLSKIGKIVKNCSHK